MICRKIGKSVTIEKHAYFSHKVTIGDNSGIGERCYLQGEVVIGENVMMASDCLFYTVNHETKDVTKPMCQQGRTDEKPIIIGNDVWIGSRVIILPGVHIDDGAIIGAGTVVTRDVPSYAVYCGNPGRIVKYRR